MSTRLVEVKDGQSIFDIAIQEYGTIMGADQIVDDNPDVVSSVTDTVVVGDQLVIDEDVTFEIPEAVEELIDDEEYKVSSGVKASGGRIDVYFFASNTAPDQYDEVQFNDNTSGAVAWYWEFGDGFTSFEQNPVHVYPGGANTEYTVRLTVWDANGNVGKAEKSNYIKVQNDSYIADKLNAPNFLLSISNQLLASQTIAFTAVEHDTGSYNTFDVGYDANGSVDYSSLSNWLTTNGYTTPYVLNFRGANDAIIAEETTISNRIYVSTAEGAIEGLAGNNKFRKYPLINSLNRDLYNHAVGAPFKTDGNKIFHILYPGRFILEPTFSRNFANENVAGATYATTLNHSKGNYEYVVHNYDAGNSVEVRWDGNVYKNTVGLQSGTNVETSDHLFYQVRGQNSFLGDVILSDDPKDNKKIEAFFRSNYPSNLYV